MFEDAEVLTQQCIISFRSVLHAGRFVRRGKSEVLGNFCNGLALAIAQGNVSREVLCLFIKHLAPEAYNWASSSGLTLSDKEISSLLIQIYTA
ncbi:hypothetical protein, partial [Erythrobacter sp. YJ-T3-07]|uniref:hypothetical protein n=1 Tax=Erythrobacter sp. YJ-T3-07 TaxID=2793063 RepID=UPI001F4247ED